MKLVRLILVVVAMVFGLITVATMGIIPLLNARDTLANLLGVVAVLQLTYLAIWAGRRLFNSIMKEINKV